MALAGSFAMWRIDGAVTQVTQYIRRVHETLILENDSMTALCGLRVLVGLKGPACSLWLEWA